MTEPIDFISLWLNAHANLLDMIAESISKEKEEDND